MGFFEKFFWGSIELFLMDSEGFLTSSPQCLLLGFFSQENVQRGLYDWYHHNIFFWGTKVFGECSERRMVTIWPFFAEMCAFEVTKIRNFAKLFTFGFFSSIFCVAPSWRWKMSQKWIFSKVYIFWTRTHYIKRCTLEMLFHYWNACSIPHNPS